MIPIAKITLINVPEEEVKEEESLDQDFKEMIKVRPSKYCCSSTTLFRSFGRISGTPQAITLNWKWLYLGFIHMSCGSIIFVSILKYLVVSWNYYHYFPDMPPSLSMEVKQLLIAEQNTNYKYSYERYRAELTFYVPKVHVRNLTHEYIDLLERGWEGTNTKIWYTSVLRTPLEDIYQSSHSSARGALRRVWTGGDYHAFIVFATDDGMIWALDRDRTGIYLSWSTATEYEPLYTVIRYFKTLRPTPIDFLSQAYTSSKNAYPVTNFTRFLREEMNRSYNLLLDNCQDFSSRTINEITQMDVWKPIPKLHLLFDAELEENATILLEIYVMVNMIVLLVFGDIDMRKTIRYILIASFIWIFSPTLHPWNMSLFLRVKS